MINKPIPTEVIVGLYHQITNLSAKNPQRKALISETALAFNVSHSTGGLLKIIANLLPYSVVTITNLVKLVWKRCNVIVN
jgi:hypothetical protein